MNALRKFALIVPTLNEAANIRTLLDGAVAALSHSPMLWEIIVVDDESSDGTGDTARQYALAEPRVRLAVRTGQHGLAGAITYGWQLSDADLLGVIDADLQHPPELLPSLLEAVCNGRDIAIASRYIRAHSMDRWSPVRRMISRVSSLASKTVQKPTIKVADPMSGFFVVRRRCIEDIRFQPTGFKLLLEILAKGHIHSVEEIPFQFAPRKHGKSKANIMTAVHYFSLLGRLMFKRGARERETSSLDIANSAPPARSIDEP